MGKKIPKIKGEEEPLICKSIQYELSIFFAHYPPKTFNRNLRNMVVDYLTNYPDPAYDLDTTIESVWKLMKLLDKVEDELRQRSLNEIIEVSKKGNYLNNEGEKR